MNRSATRSLARTRNSIGLTLTLAALALCAVVSSAAAEDGCALELSAEASSAIVGGQQSLAATVAAACGLSDPGERP